MTLFWNIISQHINLFAIRMNLCFPMLMFVLFISNICQREMEIEFFCRSYVHKQRNDRTGQDRRGIRKGHVNMCSRSIQWVHPKGDLPDRSHPLIHTHTTGYLMFWEIVRPSHNICSQLQESRLTSHSFAPELRVYEWPTEDLKTIPYHNHVTLN